jgi:hypothetical protein
VSDGGGEDLIPAIAPGQNLGLMVRMHGDQAGAVLGKGHAAVGGRVPLERADLGQEPVALDRIRENFFIERARISAHGGIAEVPEDGLRHCLAGLALLGLEARVRLVDDVDDALAAHELAVAVTRLQRLQRASNLHGTVSSIGP